MVNRSAARSEPLDRAVHKHKQMQHNDVVQATARSRRRSSRRCCATTASRSSTTSWRTSTSARTPTATSASTMPCAGAWNAVELKWSWRFYCKQHYHNFFRSFWYLLVWGFWSLWGCGRQFRNIRLWRFNKRLYFSRSNVLRSHVLEHFYTPASWIRFSRIWPVITSSANSNSQLHHYLSYPFRF